MGTVSPTPLTSEELRAALDSAVEAYFTATTVENISVVPDGMGSVKTTTTQIPLKSKVGSGGVIAGETELYKLFMKYNEIVSTQLISLMQAKGLNLGASQILAAKIVTDAEIGVDIQTTTATVLTSTKTAKLDVGA